MKRVVLAISAVAALLLGLEKVGVYRIVPGGETGFECTPLDDRAGYLLRHSNSTGNLTSWVRLTVRGRIASGVKFVPVEWTGDGLVIVSRPLGDGRLEVTISKAPNPPRGTPFVWGAGLDLQIADSGAVIAPTVENWAVFPSGQAPDSQSLATRRRRWTIVSWILLPLAAFGTALTALTALKETGGAERVTTRTFVTAIINDIDGDSPAETKRLRLFIRRVVLDDVPVDQALTKAGFKSAGAWAAKRERYAFQAKAIHLFRTRADNVVAEFGRYGERLKVQ